MKLILAILIFFPMLLGVARADWTDWTPVSGNNGKVAFYYRTNDVMTSATWQHTCQFNAFGAVQAVTVHDVACNGHPLPGEFKLGGAAPRLFRDYNAEYENRNSKNSWT